MSKISKTQFYEIRNNVYGGLVEKGIIKESDNTFIEIENLIISTAGLDIDWDDERPVDKKPRFVGGDVDYWDRVRRSRELAAMDNQSPLDSGNNQSY